MLQIQGIEYKKKEKKKLWTHDLAKKSYHFICASLFMHDKWMRTPEYFWL